MSADLIALYRIVAGDIGADPREYEVEPIEAPISVPEPEKVPVPA